MELEQLSKIETETKALEDRINSVEAKIKENEDKKFNIVAKGTESMSQVVGSRTNSDEAQAMRYFDCGSIKELLDVNVGSAKYRDVPEHLKHLVLSVKRDLDVCRLTQQILNGEPIDRDEKTSNVKGILDGNYYGKNVLAPKLKAFSTTGVGEGLEWVPTAVASQYIEEYELDRVVASKMRQVNMPTSPYDLPVLKGVTKARRQNENSPITGTNAGTDKISFSAIKLAEFYPLSEEINEDSAPAILTMARSEVVEAVIRAIESAIIRGDTTAPHMDTDTAALGADVAEKSWKGLVNLALENSANDSLVSFSAAALSILNLRKMRQQMGKFGINPRELTWITSPKTYNQLLALPEATTVEKFGPMATILQGALTALDGIPICISEYMRDDLTLNGVNGASLNDFSSILLVNHRRFFLGTRRPIRVKAVMHPVPPNDQWLLAAWWRGAFEGHEQGASEVSVTYGHNVA